MAPDTINAVQATQRCQLTLDLPPLLLWGSKEQPLTTMVEGFYRLLGVRMWVFPVTLRLFRARKTAFQPPKHL